MVRGFIGIDVLERCCLFPLLYGSSISHKCIGHDLLSIGVFGPAGDLFLGPSFLFSWFLPCG